MNSSQLILNPLNQVFGNYALLRITPHLIGGVRCLIKVFLHF